MDDKNIGIFWFRQDLRLNDNLALNDVIKNSNKAVFIYILDEDIRLGRASMWWLNHSLNSLNLSLKEFNSQLFFFKGSPKIILNNLIKKYDIKRVHWNRLYDRYSIKRDTEIKNILNKKKINVASYGGSLINEPWSIKNKSGSFFKVFTPYWNNCLDKIDEIKLYKISKEIDNKFINIPESLTLKDLNLYDKKLEWTKKLSYYWAPGENKALECFNYFKEKVINNYDEGRDRPDKDYTSRLSPYIHFGEISPHRIYKEVNKINISNTISKKKYLSEIGWREFSYNLLYNYPDIRTKAIQEKFLKFPWEKKSKYLKSWQNGKTGYPIVDAGMRELYETGWMHNRVRMIVGSFLCKNLLIHWWEGEKWFYDKLLDADLGSNSAGWQWIAGCGADAAPYFRVFNPVSQGLKFDPNGAYVKKYLTKLKNIPSRLVHSPWELSKDDQNKYSCIIGKDYPKPIVDLSESRNRALDAFKTIRVIK